MTTVRRRGTALVTLTSATGLLLGTAALGAGPATSAEPAGDCTPAFPVAELAEGDAVTTKSVTRGTAPRTFTGEVLGVYEDGIAPGLDMVMVEIDLPEGDPDRVDRAGIWQGMSGSPVYAEDGRLIGAIAYGLSYGPSPVAGVTPYEHMDDYLAAEPAAERPVSKAMATTIARRTDVSAAQAREGIAQLPMPVGVSGVKAARLAGTKDRPYFRAGTQAVGGSAAADVEPGTVVAGGNMAASLSYGDVTQAAVGTVTAVCDGRVVGFGHPMTFAGETTMSLHPASAVYVHSDGNSPGFKVANIGAPAGSVTEDHLTGLTGALGALPETSTISSTVTYDGRSRTGTTQNSVDPAAASTTFYQVIANHDRVVDAIMPGSETMTWTIRGTDTDGSAYEITFSDRFVSEYDISYEVGYDVADLVWALSRLDGVTVDEVTVDSVVSDDSSSYRVRGLQQQRGGTWTPLGRGEPALAKAGKKLELRAALVGPSGVTYVPVTLSVPEAARGTRGQLFVMGGNWMWTGGSIGSVAKAQKVVAAKVRNDELHVEMLLPTGRKELVKTKVVGPADKVVNGRKRVRVVVR